MAKPLAQLEMFATWVTTADGKFHPAIEVQGKTYAWYNIKKATWQEAYEHAGLAIKDAMDAAQAVVNSWNIQEE